MTKTKGDGKTVRDADTARVARREAARAYRLAKDRLRDACRRASGLEPDTQSRFADRRKVVLSTIGEAEYARIIEDLGDGDGGELRTSKRAKEPKFHSAYSSCGLAVNTFGPWRLDPLALTLLDKSGFTALCFEVKLPINRRWSRAPNLDLVLTGSRDCVAVESKLTEYLSPKEAKFGKRYQKAVDELAHASWKDVYEKLRENPTMCTRLDAAQLVKHYLGIKRRIVEAAGDGCSWTLLYAYWEPQDAAAYEPFRAHRAEIQSFLGMVADPEVEFRAICYNDLWSEWEKDDRFRTHAQALKARYEVRLNE